MMIQKLNRNGLPGEKILTFQASKERRVRTEKHYDKILHNTFLGRIHTCKFIHNFKHIKHT